MRFLPLLCFLLIFPAVYADMDFEIYTSPLDPIVLPSGDCQYLISARMGANETGENHLIINLMWDLGSGWSYQKYTATLLGKPVVFDVSEKDDSVSGKHRVTFESSAIQPPPLSNPENLTITVDLIAPNVDFATYTLDVAAMWYFNETELREANSSVVVSKPDLVPEITFSDSNPREGDSITVYASIYNAGGKAENFKVELLVDGASEGNTTMSLSAGTTDVAEFAWRAIKGTHWIAVIADSDGVIDELDEGNNEAIKQIAVEEKSPVETGPSVGEDEPSVKPEIVLLANSIDYNLSSDFTAFLKNKGIEIIYTDATNFSQHNTSKFIVILGGPDAYEGVGEIVQGVLNENEQKNLRERGNQRMYIKSDVWASGQVVRVIAGSDREQTQKAEEENKLGVEGVVKDTNST